MSKRTPLSKKERFNVFKRDGFSCQYCGNKAPEVVLEVDHIVPVASGGNNDILNLITSCFDCNRGKGKHSLTIENVSDKTKTQLEILKEKKEQIELMIEWQRGLQDINDALIDSLVELWMKECPEASGDPRKEFKKLLKKYKHDEIIDAIHASSENYLHVDENGREYEEGKALGMVGRICCVHKRSEAEPYLKDLYSIRAYMTKKRFRFNPSSVFQKMKKAVQLGVDVETIRELARSCRSHWEWESNLEKIMDKIEQ